MRRSEVSPGAVVALVAGLALLTGAACTGGEPRRVMAAPAPAADALAGALLDATDLPDGWPAHDPLRASGTPLPAGLRATADAARFGVNPYLAQTVDVYHPAGGPAAMAALRALFTPNTTYAMTFPAERGGTRTMRVSFGKQPSPKLGDESFSVSFDAADGGKGSIVAIRRGDTITTLRHYTVGAAGGSVKGRLTRELAERADERLARLVGGR